jgi:tetratricopeptide (TPR) repeat protein
MPVSHGKLEEICAKNPTSILFARLADGVLRQGDVKRASEICRRGLRYRPSYVTGHLVMGKCHIAAGRLEEARQEFHRVLQLDQDNLAAFWHLGQIDLEVGWEALARRHFGWAYTLDPFNRDLLAKIESFQQAPPAPEQTLDAFPDGESAVLEQAPESGAGARVEAGFDAVGDGDLDALVREVGGNRDSVSGAPAVSGDRTLEGTDPIATSTLAELYATQGLIQQALEVLERVLKRDPGNQQVKQRLEELQAMDDVPGQCPNKGGGFSEYGLDV